MSAVHLCLEVEDIMDHIGAFRTELAYSYRVDEENI